MAENLVINGVKYNGVESLAMQNEDGEEVEYYADAVRYNAQELTDGQKAQARVNIGAVSGGDLSIGIASDGLIYLFVNGSPVGTGIPQGQSGDVFGYVDENNTVVLTGNLADGTYSIKYEMEDGSTVDIGNLVLGEESAYTNLADPTSIYWKEGYRLSITSGGTSALAGHTTTNFIPAKMNDVLRVKGMKLTSATVGSGACKIVTYTAKDSEGSKINGMYGTTTMNASEGYANKVIVDGDVSEYILFFDNNGAQIATATMNYIRIDGTLIDGYTKEDVIITINEEIV